MADTVIRAEGLGKKYTIGHAAQPGPYNSLRDAMARAARSVFRKAGDMLHGRPIIEGDQLEEVWALRDIDFEIRRGEVVGVIGSNGAGKSTLLKILSRITEPSEGRVRIDGRVASLLEVGTGFHPELSGRENIFLNGAILGMSREVVRKKFDEIVAFAEVERYLDTPVKRYSSGMHVRLAFAVAAHLEPEILIVDEVLAVGDLEFQKKCIGKMQQSAADESRTVLFVSHNLQIVRRLCTKGMLMQKGCIDMFGETGPVLDRYCSAFGDAAAIDFDPPPELLDRCYVTAVSVETPGGSPVQVVPVGEPWRVVVKFRLAQDYKEFVVAVGIQSADGTAVQTGWCQPSALEAGEYQAVFEQDQVVLEAGHYNLLVGLNVGDRTIQQVDAAHLDIVAEGARGYYPAVAGIGIVLQSMKSGTSRLS